MKSNNLNELILSLKLIFTHYSNYLFHYPKHRGQAYLLPIFKFIVSSTIYQFTITTKKLFPNFYLYLKSNKKLKFTVKKIVKFDEKKIKATNQFFIYVYKKFLDTTNPRSKIVYIDITQYKDMEYKTGIQRVVSKIIAELRKKSKNKLKISYFYFPKVFPNAYLAEYDLKTNTTIRYFFPKKEDIIFFFRF